MAKRGKGIHSCPENAGAQNLPEGYVEKRKDEMGTMGKILPVYKHSFTIRENYKGHWSDEDLEKEITEFFAYCDEVSLKPSKSAIQLWLDLSDRQYYDWQNDTVGKYGLKSRIIAKANFAIESTYIERGEKYPTMNMFLLRSNHNMVEQNKVDITSNGNTVSVNEVSDLVSKLGLNEK